MLTPERAPEDTTMRSDSQLQASVLARLREEPGIGASNVGVAVREGVVTLTGEVGDLAKRVNAARVAQLLPGVRALANDIVVRLPPSQLRSDADIAYDVVNALAWDTEVPDTAVRARVQDRWVWLGGETDWTYQRAAAERAVENIAGVKGVTNLVRIRRRPRDPWLATRIWAAPGVTALDDQLQVEP